MTRQTTICFVIVAVVFGLALSPPSLAQEWKYRLKPKGTLKLVEIQQSPILSAVFNYAEGLIAVDKDNDWVACLAEDWRWIDNRTIEFKLREGVRFHNGEKFDAKAVRANWEEYRKMATPENTDIEMIPDETVFETIDEYTVRFTFPAPDGLAFIKFHSFRQIAPSFFFEHKFAEKNWGFLPEAGPWGTGPFMFVEGGLRYGEFSDQLILEAYEGYWDRRYPKVGKLVFDNRLLGNRDEAMRLCREEDGQVDIVSFIRPLDTLKIADSPFAKVVKSTDVTGLGCLFNMRKKDSKWLDIRLRKAINYAVNRKELWKYCARGNAYNLEGHPIPVGAYGHNPDLTPLTYNTARANSLLADAGYPDGFEAKIITPEAWKLEAQITSKMLERIGLNVIVEVLTIPELYKKFYIPVLDKSPEEQDWDMVMLCGQDWWGHPGASLLTYGFIEDSDMRWIEYDSTYEEMWKDMARAVEPKAQEEKIRQMAKYLRDQTYALSLYSPLTLYAVNKEVNFVPQKNMFLRLKETSVTENHWSRRDKNN